MLTTSGWQEVTRLRLVAVDDEGHSDSAESCARLLGTTSVYPLDTCLGIDSLPFKATADEALRIARAGATSPSYRDAAMLLEEGYGVRLSDVLVREVAEYVGEIALWEDRRLAGLAVAAHDPSAIRSLRRGRRHKDGFTLFAEADGAMPDSLRDEGGTAVILVLSEKLRRAMSSRNFGRMACKAVPPSIRFADTYDDKGGCGLFVPKVNGQPANSRSSCREAA